MLPEHATKVVLACCVLHNFLRCYRCPTYCPSGFADTTDTGGNVILGNWRIDAGNDLGNIQPTVNRNPAANATMVRDTFINYLNNEGALAWQVNHVNRT